MPEGPLILHTAPIGSLLSDKQLLNGRVQYQYFIDPQFKHELYTGIITDVKTHPLYGLQVFIHPDASRFNLVPRWASFHQVKGWAWFAPAENEPIAETQKAIA